MVSAVDPFEIFLLITFYAYDNPTNNPNPIANKKRVIAFVIKVLLYYSLIVIPRLPQIISPGSGAFLTKRLLSLNF